MVSKGASKFGLDLKVGRFKNSFFFKIKFQKNKLPKNYLDMTKLPH